MRFLLAVFILSLTAIGSGPAFITPATAQQRPAEYRDDGAAQAVDRLQRGFVRRYGRTALRLVEIYKRQADQLLKQKNFRGAVPLWERALAGAGNRYDLWQRYAYTLASLSRSRQGVIAAYGAYQAAKRPQDKAYSLYLLGFSYENLKSYDQAITVYEAALRFRRRSDVNRRLTRLIMRHRQQVMSSRVEKETDTPRICLTFSRNLPADDPSLFQQYVKVDPEVKVGFDARGRILCMEGVRHGRTYNVTVREGLPEAKGALKTIKTATYRISVPNRDARTGFRGETYILPRVGRRGIPMISVNVSRAQVRVLRINDRNLVNQINDGQLFRLLSGSRGRAIADITGEQVWTGTVDIEKVDNKQVTTAIPAGEILKTTKPGVYIIMARPWRKDGKYKSWTQQATQWLVISDLGISTYRGEELTVFVRSFATGKPYAGAKVVLVARNNKILGTATADATGRVTFAAGVIRGSGGNRPAAVMVRTEDGDFNFQHIGGPAFDLSDRGVSGRRAPGPVDAYVYTERGVYRPGETVHVVALLRDDRAMALAGMPVTFKLFRPDGVQARRFVVKPDAQSGGYTVSIKTSKAYRTGGWTLRAYANPKGRAVGSVRFQVEDFVPEKLEMTLKAAADDLRPGRANSVNVDGRFLYGAPAADLVVEATLRLEMNYQPYEDWKGYTFGLVTETWRAKRIQLKATRTDAKGRAIIPIALDGVPETTRPLKATIRVSLLETGGRALERVIRIPVRSRPLVLGVKLNHDGNRVGNGEDASISVIALNQDAKRRAAGDLQYRLFREVYEYYWYFKGGRWRYRVVRRDEPVKNGVLNVAADQPGKLSFKTGSGRYRLEVRHASGAATSVRYYVGWWTPPGRDNVPDKLSVRLDKKGYKAGDTAKVFLRPPFDGTVHLVVATKKVLYSTTVEAKRSGTTVDIKVDGAWGPGAYVIATAYRPMDAAQKIGPSRAIGLAYISRDYGDRTLGVSIEAPEQIKPRQKVEVAVKVANAKPGEKVFVSVAAVDEGILSLTGYKSPSPEGYYYAKRTLALDVRDDYGRLIDAFAGAFGKVRQGGDAAGARSMGQLDASSVKTTALFAGIVEVGPDGTAKVTLDVPDFNGRLRLMAVAWSKSSVGHADKPMTVRDPVVSLVTLPRFLAPNDQGTVTVSLNNVDGDAGRYTVALTTDGGAAGTGGKAQVVRQLAKKGRSVERFTLVGKTIGVSTVTMTLTGPNGFRISRQWQIAVRPAQVPVTSFSVRRLTPRTSQNVSGNAGRFLPGTMRVLVSFANTPDLGVPGLLASLNQYPYGCAEQTTSKALPLLYVADVAKSIGVASDEAAVRARVQAAINRVLNMQTGNGGFGMWSASDAQGGWLTAYIVDFLTQAKKRGYVIPEYPYERALERLQWIVGNTKYDPPNLPVIAYAYYVLAANQKTTVADLRYFHDNWLKKLPTALAKAQIGAALALYGDADRAKGALLSAIAHDGRPKLTGRYWRSFVRDYGTVLRDKSAVLYFASSATAGIKDLPALVALVAQLRGQKRHLSTQEKAWLLLAAHATSAGDARFSVSVGQQAVQNRIKPLYISLKDRELRRGVRVTNTGTTAVWQGVTVTGIPVQPLPRASQGFTIRRVFYTLDGKRADLTRVKQSQVLVAVIRVEATTARYHQALLVDLLPAGFELENARLRGQSVSKMKWLPKLSYARHIDKRDDRYVAAIDIGGRGRSFHMAYLVRAVTPGTFRLPAAHIEDMYRPSIFGRDAMGYVRILPR